MQGRCRRLRGAVPRIYRICDTLLPENEEGAHWHESRLDAMLLICGLEKIDARDISPIEDLVIPAFFGWFVLCSDDSCEERDEFRGFGVGG